MGEKTGIPCPLCDASSLLYDGIVRWRSGPRPLRSLARPRHELATTPRADYDESAYYHCRKCGAEFVDHLISKHGPLRIQETDGGPTYIYNEANYTWELQQR